MTEQNIIMDELDLLFMKHDEYRRISDEAQREADEAHARDDREAYKTHMLRCLEYLRYSYEVLEEIHRINRKRERES